MRSDSLEVSLAIGTCYLKVIPSVSTTTAKAIIELISRLYRWGWIVLSLVSLLSNLDQSRLWYSCETLTCIKFIFLVMPEITRHLQFGASPMPPIRDRRL